MFPSGPSVMSVGKEVISDCLTTAPFAAATIAMPAPTGGGRRLISRPQSGVIQMLPSVPIARVSLPLSEDRPHGVVNASPNTAIVPSSELLPILSFSSVVKYNESGPPTMALGDK